MGCANSKTTPVQPAAMGCANSGPGADTKGDASPNAKLGSSARGGSAVSNKTTDSGVGLDSGHLPGIVARKLPPLRAAKSPGLSQDRTERQDSSDILEELLSIGLIQSQARMVRNAEAYDVTVDSTYKQLRRPPPRLESLKIKNEQATVSKEDIDRKLKAAEERRQNKEEDLRMRLRTKSAKCRNTLRQEEDLQQETLENATRPDQKTSLEKVL
ncbi:stathmin domain-containing protein 1 [Amia ocellicauda]|uniref:stathmin domain-containing protein 1 n=1 Tax=Amia ocellicauda TaxID=2972642 RepID=UPI003463CE14